MRLVPNQPLRRLQWRLTGLFVLAAALTSVLIQIVLIVLILNLTSPKQDMIEETETLLRTKTPEVEALFAGPKPDRYGLMTFLQREAYEEMGYPKGVTLQFLSVNLGPSFIAITDQTGTIIASSPEVTTFPPGKPLDAFLTRSERRLMEIAHHDKIKAVWDHSGLIAAGPIHRQGKIVGIAFVRTGALMPDKSTWISFGNTMLASLIWNAIGSGIVGGLFGFLIARSITHRLRAISAIANCWAGGDLSAIAPEKPADELGLLARQLNRMASELQQVFDLRNEVAVLEERQRITRDLHDTVKQEAFATAMMVASAQQCLKLGDTQGMQRALDEAGTLSRLMQTDLSGILKQLQMDRSSDLRQRIAELAEAWQRRSGIEIQIGEFAELMRLPIAMVNQIVSITEEAVANAIKHSRGTRVTIAFIKRSGLCTLTVCDNGIGLRPDQPSQGMGLGTMKERAALIPGGQWEIFVPDSGGTCVQLQFERGEIGDDD